MKQPATPSLATIARMAIPLATYSLEPDAAAAAAAAVRETSRGCALTAFEALAVEKLVRAAAAGDLMPGEAEAAARALCRRFKLIRTRGGNGRKTIAGPGTWPTVFGALLGVVTRDIARGEKPTTANFERALGILEGVGYGRTDFTYSTRAGYAFEIVEVQQ